MGGKKLMVPYVIFSLIGHCFLCIQIWQNGITDWRKYVLDPIYSIIFVGSTSGNTPLWFLPSLLAVQLIYSICSRKISDWGLAFLGILCAYLLFKYDIHKPLYLGNISLGIAVYAIGHKLKNIQFQREFLMMSLFVYFSLFYIQFYSIDFRANELLEGYYLLAVAFEFSGCLFINFCFKYLSMPFKLLEYVGKRSMAFYVMHWIVLLLCTVVCDYDGWKMFSTMLISSMICLPIAERSISYLNLDWVIGQKVEKRL